MKSVILFTDRDNITSNQRVTKVDKHLGLLGQLLVGSTGVWTHSAVPLRPLSQSSFALFIRYGLVFLPRANLSLQSYYPPRWAQRNIATPNLFIEMGISLSIFPGWPWTKTLLFSASQVAGITGEIHTHAHKSSPRAKKDVFVRHFIYWVSVQMLA
jgi:hypothetical protein